MEIRSTGDFIRMTRAALAAAGFVRKEIGGTVYWTGGEGEPFVLVHGANDQAGTWFTVAPELATRGRIILPDLPGHGDSEPRTGPLAVGFLLERLTAVIDVELGADATFKLAGNSLGGWIATLYTLASLGRVRHLVLETAGGLSLPFGSPVIARDGEEALVVLRAVHGPRFEPEDWQIQSLVERASSSAILRLTGVEENAIDDRLSEIRCRTTLIWGEDDGVLPLSYAAEMRNRISGSEMHVIPGAAHIPHLQKPAEVLACLMAIC